MKDFNDDGLATPNGNTSHFGFKAEFEIERETKRDKAFGAADATVVDAVAVFI